MREIIVDRGNGAKAFVLFELTKGNIAEIKDRYILEQLRSAIDSPWSTALPDGIRSALIRSVSEEMEDRFLLENMDKDTDMSVKSAIRSAAIKVFEGSTDGAYYNFVNDKISVPSREAFNSNSSFLASLLHEMGHSTAPALDRQMTGDMRSKEYAHEEIVAELSSIFSSVDLAVKAETDPEAAGYGEHVAYLEFWKGRLDSVTGTDEYEATKEELCDDFFAAASQASQATDFIIDRYEQEVGHPAAGKEIVQKLDMPEKTEQEDRADRSLSHKKETARDASAHMQGDRADLVNMRDENAIGA